MINFINWVVLLYGVYSILVLALVMNTKNFRSAVVFKIIPFISGIGCILVGLDRLGFIDIASIILK